MTRILSFIGLIILSATAPVWLVLIGMALYAFFYSGIELILLAGCVDAVLMPSTALVPVYTLASIGLLIAVELLRPYLLVE